MNKHYEIGKLDIGKGTFAPGGSKIMIIVNVHNENNFTVLANTTMRDRRLSAEARGVLGYLLTHSAEFQVTFATLRAEFNIGKDKLQGIIGELKRCGYLQVTPKQDSGGRFKGWNWTVYGRAQEINFALSEKDRVPENPSDGETDSRKNRLTENTADILEESGKVEEETTEKKESLSARAKREALPKREAVGKNRIGIPAEEIFDSDDGPEKRYWDTIVEGLKERLNMPARLHKEREWHEAIKFAWDNKVTAEIGLEVFDLLEKICKLKGGNWEITPSYWSGNVTRVEARRVEVLKLETETKNKLEKGGTNGKGIYAGNGSTERHGKSNNGNAAGNEPAATVTPVHLQGDTIPDVDDE